MTHLCIMTPLSPLSHFDTYDIDYYTYDIEERSLHIMTIAKHYVHYIHYDTII
jgi:hypothetical protein